MERQAVISDLKALREKFTSIIDLFGKFEAGFDKKQNGELIASLYSTLKEQLGILVDDLEKKERKDQLNSPEQAFFLPACREALLELKVKRGAKAGSEMASCLISADDYIRYYLDQVSM